MKLLELWMLAHLGAEMKEQECTHPIRKAHFTDVKQEIEDLSDLWDDLWSVELEDIRLYKIDTSPEHIDIEDIPDTESF